MKQAKFFGGLLLGLGLSLGACQQAQPDSGRPDLIEAQRLDDSIAARRLLDSLHERLAAPTDSLPPDSLKGDSLP
jgi:hypothetical protein